MRAGRLGLVFGLVTGGGALLGPTVGVAAQDDEFDDEFDDVREAPPAPATARTEDPFGDDEALPADDTAEQAPFDDTVDEELPTEEGAARGNEDRSLRLAGQNTWDGPVGGLRVIDAGSAAPGTFRLQLATDFSFESDFLQPGDDNSHVGGTLSLSYSLTDRVEAYGSLASAANRNTKEDPELFQVLGDTVLGIKLFAPVSRWLTAGGDVRLALLNSVGDIGLLLAGSSFGLRGNATADFRHAENPFDLSARLNIDYFFDNSSELIADVEQDRYAALPGAEAKDDEYRHLLSPVERFALNINRTDMFSFAIGLEAPLAVSPDFGIHPLLEWNLGLPVNRQGYDCLYLPSSTSADDPAASVDGFADGCLDRQGFGSFPQTLTIGARVLPPVRGLTGFAAFDIGLTGTSSFVREISATLPYDFLLGLGYAYDTVDPPTPEPVVREVERRVEVTAPVPPRGKVLGIVLEQGSAQPVSNAIVRFVGRDVSPIVTQDGRFTSYEFGPGDVQVEISHPEYNAGTCTVAIPAAGGDAELRCELVALPRTGVIRGRVTGGAGESVSAQVQISGPTMRTLPSDAAGAFQLADAVPGHYSIRVQADGFFVRLAEIDVRPRETADAQVRLTPMPARPNVVVRARDIQLRRRISFTDASATLDPESESLLEELADALIRHPEARLIEIQSHTDGGRGMSAADLSQARADAIRSWLIAHGVEGSRLEAKGFGNNRPLVPGITPANRARNRRIQLVVRERASD